MSLEPSNQISVNNDVTKPTFVNPFGLNGLQTGTKSNVDTSNKTSSAVVQNQIHIEIKSRNARKSITYLKGLSESVSMNTIDQIVKKWKKTFSCSVVNDEGIVKISGDRREEVAKYLIDKGIVDEGLIHIHGF